MLDDLHARGCHNWNLVSPTPWMPAVAAAVRERRAAGTTLPVVYNTSGYERIETLETFADDVDIYLTDLRYADAGTAAEASGAPDYVQRAREALETMWRLAGPLQVDADGIAWRGTICRILILPGRAGEAADNLRWAADTLGKGLAVSVMAQYVPAYRARGRSDAWARGITAAEYEQVVTVLEACGFETGWMQDLAAAAPPELLGFRMQAGAGP
jgi:putative pyruvate formate lyase activating enzyme